MSDRLNIGLEVDEMRNFQLRSLAAVFSDAVLHSHTHESKFFVFHSKRPRFGQTSAAFMTWNTHCRFLGRCFVQSHAREQVLCISLKETKLWPTVGGLNDSGHLPFSWTLPCMRTCFVHATCCLLFVVWRRVPAAAAFSCKYAYTTRTPLCLYP